MKKIYQMVIFIIVGVLLVGGNSGFSRSAYAEQTVKKEGVSETDPSLSCWIDFLRTTIFRIPKDNREKQIVTERGTTITTNETYTSAYSNNTFDLYQPKKALENHPTILWIHGGAFIGGGKADAGIQNYLDVLSSYGYTIVSMDYGLAPESAYPNQLIQIGELINYLKLNQEKYSLNLENLFMAGDSAGGELAAQFSATQTNPEYRNAYALDQVVAKTDIKGSLLYCGFFDLNSTAVDPTNVAYAFMWKYVGWAISGVEDWYNTDIIKSMTIKNYVTSDFPPAYITDGNKDSFTSQGEALVERLSDLGVVTSSFFCPKSEYGEQKHEFQFNLTTLAGQKALADSKNFLEQMREKH